MRFTSVENPTVRELAEAKAQVSGDHAYHVEIPISVFDHNHGNLKLLGSLFLNESETKWLCKQLLDAIGA